MKVAYISGPYRAPDIDGVCRNITAARAVAKKYWKLGYAVICPHSNTALMDGEVPDGVFLEGDIEILRRCNVIVMIAGWGSSEGAVREHNVAVDAKLEIIYEAPQ